jgi:ketosteroid isomerase-like protein
VSAVDVVLQVFRSVEERNPQLATEVYHDDLEFHWPRPLPYAGSSYGLKASLERQPGWAQTWDPFQSPSDHGLGARVVAASEDEVVVLWHQRGRDRAGRELDTPVLGLYQVRDGKLARAQMFYFDPLAAAEFLAWADAGTSQHGRREGTPGAATARRPTGDGGPGGATEKEPLGFGVTTEVRDAGSD